MSISKELCELEVENDEIIEPAGKSSGPEGIHLSSEELKWEIVDLLTKKCKLLLK